MQNKSSSSTVWQMLKTIYCGAEKEDMAYLYTAPQLKLKPVTKCLKVSDLKPVDEC